MIFFTGMGSFFVQPRNWTKFKKNLTTGDKQIYFPIEMVIYTDFLVRKLNLKLSHTPGFTVCMQTCDSQQTFLEMYVGKSSV